MPRFSYQDADKYENESNRADYLSLKDNGDTVSVRFLYRDASDVFAYATHEVTINGKKRYVNCLREYGAPIDDCPFCKEGMKTFTKMYIPCYDIKEKKVKLWERGQKFITKMVNICNRFQKDGDICKHTFDIVRNGAKGDTATTYDIFETDKDETKLTDLPPAPDALGTCLLDKTAEEMKQYLVTGDFPYNSGSGEKQDAADEVVPKRRVPADADGSEKF